MTRVRITFEYDPDEGADDDHDLGITEDEYTRVSDLLMEIGAEDPTIEKVSS